MEPYEAYCKYLAIQLHFNSPTYDYFKYNGKVRTDPTKFDVRKDKYMYYRLSKKENVELFLASNFLREEKIWIGNLLSEEKYMTNFKSAQKTIQSLEYTVKTELSQFDSWDEALSVPLNGDYPKLYNAYKKGRASPETLLIVYELNDLSRYWQSHISDKIIYPRQINRLLKYRSFFQYDRAKYNRILLDMYS